MEGMAEVVEEETIGMDIRETIAIIVTVATKMIEDGTTVIGGIIMVITTAVIATGIIIMVHHLEIAVERIATADIS